MLKGCISLERLTMADSARFPIRELGQTGKGLSMMEAAVVDSLRYVYLGASMGDVSPRLFYGKGLQSVEVGRGNAQYSSAGGVVYSSDGTSLLVMGTAFSGDYTVPIGCTQIAMPGFDSCSGLRRLTIPSTVSSIDAMAFSNANPTVVAVRDSYAAKRVAELRLSVEYRDSDYDADGWVTLAGGRKGYARGGRLVTGWLDLGSAKYYFQPDGSMSVGWTDVVVDGKTMHYYFNPASGNLVRGTWFTIGASYYFRPSGNLATGWATIRDGGTDKKYYFEEDGTLVKDCWRDIDNGRGVKNHYYFRPSGSMATGWATIDGRKYWFRPSGNMATGFADVDDAHKRYFDEAGVMLTGWQQIGGKTYYFRPSGAMQTGTATIGGKAYVFSDRGVLVS